MGVGFASSDMPPACTATHSGDWSRARSVAAKDRSRCQACGTLMVTSTLGLTFSAPSMAENGLMP